MASKKKGSPAMSKLQKRIVRSGKEKEGDPMSCELKEGI